MNTLPSIALKAIPSIEFSKTLSWALLFGLLTLSSLSVKGTHDPFLVKDINEDGRLFGSEPDDFAVLGDNLYFTGNTDRSYVSARRLFRYNGSEISQVITDPNPRNGGYAEGTFVFKNKLYFGAGNEGNALPILWRVDEATEPQPLHEIFDVQMPYWKPSNFYIMWDKLFFTTDGGNRLWSFDGETAPVRVAQLSSIGEIFTFQDKLFMTSGDKFLGELASFHIYSYDGTNQPIREERLSPTLFTKKLDHPLSGFHAFEGKLYFSKHTVDNENDPQEITSQLMVYDGTGDPSAVEDVSEINRYYASFSQSLKLFTLNDKLYTKTTTNIPIDEGGPLTTLWDISDENTPGQVDTVQGGYNRVVHLYGKLFVDAADESDAGIWTFDGHRRALESANLEIYNHFDRWTVFQNKIFGQLHANNTGRELGVYDPQTDELSIAVDVYPGNEGSYPAHFCEMGGKTYFTAVSDAVRSVFVAENMGKKHTSPDIALLENFADGVYNIAALKDQLLVFSSALEFSSDPQVPGGWYYYLHTYKEGEETKTLRRAYGSRINGHVIHDDKLYFITPNQVWMYDGVNDPVVIASEDKEGIDFRGGGPLRFFQGKLYFQGVDEGQHWTELWVCDVSEGTLSTLREVHNSERIPSPTSYLTVFKDKLYFQGVTTTHGKELWSYDGVSSPSLVIDINPGEGWGSPHDLVVFQDNLVFATPDYQGDNNELWKYDGINEPTMLVDISPDGGRAFPEDLYVHNDRLHFSVNHSGFEGAMVYDGEQVTSIFGETENEMPNSFILPLYETPFHGIGECLYMNVKSDDNPLVGHELWSWCPEEPCPEENRVSSLDVNGDGYMSIFDLYPLIEKMGTPCTPGWCVREGDDPACYCDFNGDGGVSIFDFYFFALYFGEPADVYNPWEVHHGKTDVTTGELILDVNKIKRNADGSVTAPLYFGEQLELGPVKALAMAFQTASEDAMQQVALTYNTDKFGALNDGHATLEHFDASSQVMQSGIAFVGDQTTTGAGMIGTLTFIPAKGTGDFNMSDVNIAAFEAYAYDALGNQVPLRLAKRAGLSVQDNTPAISLWHDAVNQQLVINGLPQHDAVQIQVMSLAGMSILESTLTGSSVDLSTLPAGQYMVTLSGSSLAKTQIERLTVVR